MIKFPGIIKDHAVLQANKQTCIWGYTDSVSVTVSLLSKEGKCIFEQAVTSAEEDEQLFGFTGLRKFAVNLEPMSYGGPYLISVRAQNGDEVTVSDIFFGEVWLAGGQSNMELELQNSKNGKEVVANACNDRIRFYYTPKLAFEDDKLLAAEAESEWDLCVPEKVARWSAVGFYFAQALTEELDDSVMIGIIGCNWGGTSASAWMSAGKLSEHAETEAYLDRYKALTKDQSLEEHARDWKEYEIYQAEFDKNVGHYYQTAENPNWDEAIRLFGENRYPGPMGPFNWTRPAGLYTTMIRRIAPYTLAGALYYQGEDDDNRPYSYERLLTSLVEQWREDFKDDKLPFMIVQLPIFKNEGEDDDKNWPFIREAQSNVSAKIGSGGLAVILETGEYHNIHPLDKETVGYRLAYQALYHVYGTMTEWDTCGPAYDSGYAEGDSYFINLKCCDKGLIIDNDEHFLDNLRFGDEIPESAGFEVAGEDCIYYPASAKLMVSDDEALDDGALYDEARNIENGKDNVEQNEARTLYENNSWPRTDAPYENEEDILDIYKTSDEEISAMSGINLLLKLHSSKVSKPVMARYFWTNYKKVEIFGANGIPLAPFRTNPCDGARCVNDRCRQGEVYGEPKAKV